MEPSVSTSQRSGSERRRFILLLLLMNVLALSIRCWWWPSWSSADFSLACLYLLLWTVTAGCYGYLRSKSLLIYVAVSVLLVALSSCLRGLGNLDALSGYFCASDLRTLSFLLMALNIPILCTSHLFHQTLSHVSGRPPAHRPLGNRLGLHRVRPPYAPPLRPRPAVGPGQKK